MKLASAGVWLLPLLAVAQTNAPTNTPVDLQAFSSAVLLLDVDVQSAQLDEQIAQSRLRAADNLYRGSLSVAPFMQDYELQEPASLAANSYEQSGVSAGYTQYLPLGTQLTFSVDQISDSTQSALFKKERGYTISVVQPLWRNQLGQSQRAGREAAHAALAAQAVRQLSARNQACLRAAETYVDTWTQEEKSRFVAELAILADELYKKTEQAHRRGQIGRLDWLGVQSDYVNLQSLKSQTLQQLAAFKNAMAQMSESYSAQLRSPESEFAWLGQLVKKQPAQEPTYDERYQQKQVQLFEHKAKAEKSQSLPQLDLKLSRQAGEGKIVSSAAEDYRDEQLTLSLDLVWNFNDGSLRSPADISLLEARRALIKEQELRRNRGNRFASMAAEIAAQAEQISFDHQRTVILGQITTENKTRFFHGRIEFQDFLLVKERWFEQKNRLLERQASYWKNLVRFAVQENFSMSFCGGAR